MPIYKHGAYVCTYVHTHLKRFLLIYHYAKKGARKSEGKGAKEYKLLCFALTDQTNK